MYHSPNSLKVVPFATRIARKWFFRSDSFGAKALNILVSFSMVATDLLGAYATFLPLPVNETTSRFESGVGEPPTHLRTFLGRSKSTEDLDPLVIPYLADNENLPDWSVPGASADSLTPIIGALDTRSSLATSLDILEPVEEDGNINSASARPFDLPLTRVALSHSGQDLVVTDTVYIDDARYPMTTTLITGTTAITISAVVTDIIDGDEILIINMLGEDIGTYETVTVTNVTTGTTSILSIVSPLVHTFDGTTDKVVVLKVPHYNEVIVESGGILTVHPWDGMTGGAMFLRALTMTVSGMISVDGLGFTFTQNGPGAPPKLYDHVAGGGSHGGYGGGGNIINDWAPMSSPYGSVIEPTTMGSAGGRWKVTGSYSGMPGGGLIILDVANTLSVDLYGQVSANGQGINVEGEGGGAGGSIWVMAQMLTGAGRIQANGGEGYKHPSLGNTYLGSGGSGGRVAIFAQNALDFMNAEAAGGFVKNSDILNWGLKYEEVYYGGPGTIFLKSTNSSETRLRVSNGTLVDPEGHLSRPAAISTPDEPVTWDFTTVELLAEGDLELDDEDTIILTATNMDGDGSGQIYLHTDLTYSLADLRYVGLNMAQGTTLTLTVPNLRVYGTQLTINGVLAVLN